MTAPLPIDTVLPELVRTLRQNRRAVLHAPTGAGKTTRVPLALLDAGWVDGRIVMLEPRRIAARMAAQRMAEERGERPGETIGYRMRGESRVSGATRVEVVTEGILTRMIQSDPTLDGIGAVIFDEFHERSLHADLGLALALEVASTLREDLVLLVMSATLDVEPVARLLGGAPTVVSKGRSFPVDIRHLDKPLPREARIETETARAVETALASETGDILVFLPGAAEIRRVAAHLSDAQADIRPLFGALPFAEQRRALAPSEGRRVVIATSIAETSLTIPGVRVVIDAGLARRARFDPGSGMTRLVTEPVSRAEADQRAGRAGRREPGVAIRLWAKGQHGALPAFAPPEIEVADLTPLALELAEWGASDLAFLTPPPAAPLSRARALLRNLGALDDSLAITPHGRDLARLPLHPRLGHMLTLAGVQAAELAALLSARDPMHGAGVDMRLRVEALRRGAPEFADVRREAKRLRRLASDGAAPLTLAQQAALAYPDRIAQRRAGEAPRWLLSGGKGVRMEPLDPLAQSRYLVVTDTDGHPREATIRQAAEITQAELREVPGLTPEVVRTVFWDAREGRVVAQTQERLGATSLSATKWREAPGEARVAAMLEGVRVLGLPSNDALERFRARVAAARRDHPDLPDLSDETLLETVEQWLAPYIAGVETAAAWRSFDLLPALKAMIGWDGMQKIDRAAPESFVTPLGRKQRIDYATGAPEIAVRLQEMFGTTRHPHVAGQPLRVTLLSPAGRPLQTTTDLPGFWENSYADVRKEMRGRYPKHPWPDNPAEAQATLRAKPRS